MAQDRNLVVTEARLGLSLITCLLLVLGYVVLQRLGGTGQRPPVEILTRPSLNQAEAASPSLPDESQPHVLTPEGWEPTQLPIQTSQRPEWLTPLEGVDDGPLGALEPFEMSSFSEDTTPSLLDLSDPWRVGDTPNDGAVR